MLVVKCPFKGCTVDLSLSPIFCVLLQREPLEPGTLLWFSRLYLYFEAQKWLNNGDTQYPERISGSVYFILFPKLKQSIDKCLSWIKLNSTQRDNYKHECMFVDIFGKTICTILAIRSYKWISVTYRLALMSLLRLVSRLYSC